MKCPACHRLSLKPCRASRRCMSWASAHECYEAATYRPDDTVRYSKAAGKFVVPMFSEAA